MPSDSAGWKKKQQVKRWPNNFGATMNGWVFLGLNKPISWTPLAMWNDSLRGTIQHKYLQSISNWAWKRKCWQLFQYANGSFRVPCFSTYCFGVNVAVIAWTWTVSKYQLYTWMPSCLEAASGPTSCHLLSQGQHFHLHNDFVLWARVQIHLFGDEFGILGWRKVKWFSRLKWLLSRIPATGFGDTNISLYV